MSPCHVPANGIEHAGKRNERDKKHRVPRPPYDGFTMNPMPPPPRTPGSGPGWRGGRSRIYEQAVVKCRVGAGGVKRVRD